MEKQFFFLIYDTNTRETLGERQEHATGSPQNSHLLFYEQQKGQCLCSSLEVTLNSTQGQNLSV